RLHVLSDQPLGADVGDAEDRLGFTAYADAVAGIIDNPKTGTPLTIAISAPWGAGKSTLAAMIRRRLTSKPAAGGSRRHVPCRFNAWMHDDAKTLGAAFAAEVARAANLHRPLYRRVIQPLPLGLAGPADRWRQLLLWGGLMGLLFLVALALFGAKA